MVESVKQFINEQSIVFQIILYGIIFSYVYNIITSFFHLCQIWKGIIRLNQFINAYKKGRRYKWKCKLLLSYFPIILRYLDIHSKRLEYGDEYYILHQKAIEIRNNLLSKKDFQMHKFRASFSPVLGFKTFITFPMVVFSWFNIKPRKHSLQLLGLIGWVISFVFSMFQPELKKLLIIVFKYLIHG